MFSLLIFLGILCLGLPDSAGLLYPVKERGIPQSEFAKGLVLQRILQGCALSTPFLARCQAQQM
jgi:hypothetical protein